VARLATAGRDAAPHVVPFVFAVDRDRIYWAVDQKPKRSTSLRRLANIAANPRVSAVVDHYDEDWELLWWVRADGMARVVEELQGKELALALLAAKYPQYRERPPAGPVVDIAVDSWRSWTARPT
jgi:PPOX class probable F420-dependent enzyme